MLFFIQKDDKNVQIRQKMTQKANEFFARAELIKNYLEESSASKQEKQNHEKPMIEKQREQYRKSLEDAILKQKPDIKWEDVAGLESAKKALEEAVILPQMYPQLFQGKVKPWKCVCSSIEWLIFF